jgi:hypothetical protein
MNRWYGLGRAWVEVGRERQGERWVRVLVSEEDGRSAVFAHERGEVLVVTSDHRGIQGELVRAENRES